MYDWTDFCNNVTDISLVGGQLVSDAGPKDLYLLGGRNWNQSTVLGFFKFNSLPTPYREQIITIKWITDEGQEFASSCVMF